MTDLERAQAIWADWVDGPTLPIPIEVMAAALAAARREGAEEMRDRAAQAVEDMPIAMALGAASAIRALPLTPEEPT